MEGACVSVCGGCMCECVEGACVSVWRVHV